MKEVIWRRVLCYNNYPCDHFLPCHHHAFQSRKPALIIFYILFLEKSFDLLVTHQCCDGNNSLKHWHLCLTWTYHYSIFWPQSYRVPVENTCGNTWIGRHYSTLFLCDWFLIAELARVWRWLLCSKSIC